jgi:hypothetical protein
MFTRKATLKKGIALQQVKVVGFAGDYTDE